MYTRAKSLTSIVLICTLGMGIGVEVVGTPATAASSSSCTTSAKDGSCVFTEKASDFTGISPGAGRPRSRGIEVDQDIWSSCKGSSQKILASSPENYQVVANYPAGNTAICSYPNVWPHDASGAVNGYSKITSSFSESFPHNAQTAAHAMYDLWFNNWSYEVMVQYDFSNDGACQGSWPLVKTNVTFGGSNGVPTQAWHLCKGNGGQSLVWKLGANDGSQERSESSGTVDILAMVKYLEKKDYIPANAKWTAISMGWEIASTGGKDETFAGSGFTVDMVPK
jgi:hypothetical protein